MTIIPSINYSVALGKRTITTAKIEGSVSALPPGYQEWADGHGVGGPAENEDADRQPNLVEFVFGQNPTVARNYNVPTVGNWDMGEGARMTINFEHPPGTGDLLEILIGDGLDEPLRPAKFTEVTGSNFTGFEDFKSQQEFDDYVRGKADKKWVNAWYGRQSASVCAKAKIGEPGGFLSLRVKC